MIGCEDRLRNDLYCVGCGVKLYSNQTKAGWAMNHRGPRLQVSVWSGVAGCTDYEKQLILIQKNSINIKQQKVTDKLMNCNNNECFHLYKCVLDAARILVVFAQMQLTGEQSVCIVDVTFCSL